MLVFYSRQGRNILSALYIQFNVCTAIELFFPALCIWVRVVGGGSLLFSRLFFLLSAFINVYLCALVLKNVCLFCFYCSLNPTRIHLCESMGFVKIPSLACYSFHFFCLLLFFFGAVANIFSLGKTNCFLGGIYKSVTSCSQHDIWEYFCLCVCVCVYYVLTFGFASDLMT